MVLGKIMIKIIMVVQFCAVGIAENYIVNNITWFTTKLHEYPTMHFELYFQITFPVDICCPVLFFSMHYGLYQERCFPSDIERVPGTWYKNALFHLNTSRVIGSSNVKCAVNSTLNEVLCNSHHVIDQDYEPKQRYIYLGYPCNKVKEITQLNFQINIQKELNATSCQPTVKFEQSGNTLNCGDFYPYTSLPNVFGDLTQAEAKKSMEPFNSYLSYYQGKYCHKHLMKLVCMTFLPMCPFNSNVSSTHPETKLSSKTPITEYLILPCREAAYEINDACTTDIKLLTGLTTEYYPTLNSSVTCYYEPVTCDRPLSLKNGKVLENGTLFYARDTVHYVCDKEYKMISETNYSVCGYSGFWTPVPSCIDPKANTSVVNKGEKDDQITTNVMVIFIVVSFLLIITVVFLKVSRRTIKTNHDPVSRNKPYDAFLSYESGDDDEQFVRKKICKKLDSEYGGNYKLLIHQRDFKAGVLIMTSIQNAVRDSNCAIILLSQTYIRSPWCRQEFEECMEESKKDSNYRLIVILMQPLATIQKEKLTPYMETFLRYKTYLDCEDSRFWPKLQELLEKHKTQENTIIEAETKL